MASWAPRWLGAGEDGDEGLGVRGMPRGRQRRECLLCCCPLFTAAFHRGVRSGALMMTKEPQGWTFPAEYASAGKADVHHGNTLALQQWCASLL